MRAAPKLFRDACSRLITNVIRAREFVGSWVAQSCREKFCAILLLVGALAIPTLAHAGPAMSPGWRARIWRADDGLPDNRVTGVTQTPDGSLWIATRGGLVRFNGATFEPFELSAVKGVIGSGVRAMFSDSRGNLWLGAFREEVLRVGRDSAQRFTVAEGVPNGQLTAFAEDREGAIWLAFGGHICFVRNDRVEEVEILDRVGSGGRASLIRDASGRVWCAINGRIGVLQGGKFEQRFRLESRDLLLAAARTGGLWVSAGSRVYRLAGDGPPVERVALSGGIRPVALLEDSAGALWLGTGSDGLLRYDGRSLESVDTSHRNVGTLLEDREGNLWAGTFGGGLNRLRPRAMDLIGTQSGLPFESVVSVCPDAEGMFWVVGDSGQLARGDGSDWVIMPAGGGAAACVAADRAGRLWVGTRGYGLREIDRRTGRVRVWEQGDGLPSNSIRAVRVANDDSVWFTTNGAVRLCHLRDGRLRTYAVPATVRNIRALVQDARGVIWIGTSDGKVLKVAGDGLVSEPALARAMSTSVRCLQATPDGSLWIGYAERGVGLLKDGRYVRLTVDRGLADDSIWQIASDPSGAVWLAGPHGLTKIGPEDAAAVAEGRTPGVRSILYGYEQGLPNLQPHYGNAPAVCQSSDGRVLFSTSLGVLMVNPRNLRQNAVAPPVALERVTVDDRLVASWSGRFPLRANTAPGTIDLGAANLTLPLPPDHRRVVFEFAALSYSAPENVRFRYRLDGFDETWSPAGRERSATYSRLPAGDYVFRVTASNDTGVWNDTGVTLGVSVSPFYWQTWWFRTGVLGLFTALVVAAVRFLSYQRLRDKLRRAEQQAALFEDRARIARDIHDELGGSLAHVKLLSEIAAQDRSSTDPAEENLRQITTTTGQMLKSLDEIVWAISPSNDTLPHVISYLGQHAMEFLRSAGIRCVVDLPDDPPDLWVTSDVRHHLLLVVKEALTNVVRHARAGHVSLRIVSEKKLLRVVVEDDGVGLGNSVEHSQGDGLRNMRQRMEAVGGEVRIEQKDGGGTWLEFTVPIGERPM